ncbi:chromosome partitioning protein ParA [Mucilaginibacter sp. RB4R14]|uniref:7TM diverse intracellular signaling domain-containing protein n=1 Tax=Mucilaginibacter aurantiaciroseus TaxID=2949308 RepID=UPI00209030E5|nr:7TM diverse intracellular signaling domain-containing protein [Mucilaginibacter aurantiaciroseus]MCO5935284.1 chromosome partitioning protein ParA [Mucilaginibacter aurantiaciroseus]
MYKVYPGFLCLVFLLGCSLTLVKAQVIVPVTDTAKQHVFNYGEIQYYVEDGNRLNISQISNPAFSGKFKSNLNPTPQLKNINATYWYRITLNQSIATKNNWILEFFDQTIDSITVYSPTAYNRYTVTQLGSNRPFADRLYRHKNFGLNLNNDLKKQNVYYFRLRSNQSANVIIVLRSVNWFISYALDEYFFFGIFYGMILVFGLYNFMMFIAMRQRQYLYYIVYNLSIGLYEMCTDGIAYQYLWQMAPAWNHYAYGIALFLASIFATLFAQSLLNLKVNAPRFNNIVNGILISRCIFFLACLFINRAWFEYKIVEFIPLSFSYAAGCYILHKGYRPARFFLIGYSFLFFGFVIKTLIALNIWWLPVTALNFYSLSFCFIMEMLFITFAIGDRLRLFKREKDQAQERMIKQLQKNEELKDMLNKRLEEQVAVRTQEIMAQSSVIAIQNTELTQVNKLLQQQAEEISRMNVILEKDNLLLHNDIEKVTHDRVMLTDVDFEEFSRIYPDKETCFKFMAEIKWVNGYTCKKCANDHYGNGHQPYSRRCSKCGYEESVIAHTILQNTRIPINKAFYIIFLMYSTKGQISSHKLSEILSIRQSTCWAYSTRIKKIMEGMKKGLRNAGSKGWSKLVMETMSTK